MTPPPTPGSSPWLIGMTDDSTRTSLLPASTFADVASASRQLATLGNGVGVDSGGTKHTSGAASQDPPALLLIERMRPPHPNSTRLPSMVVSSSEEIEARPANTWYAFSTSTR